MVHENRLIDDLASGNVVAIENCPFTSLIYRSLKMVIFHPVAATVQPQHRRLRVERAEAPTLRRFARWKKTRSGNCWGMVRRIAGEPYNYTKYTNYTCIPGKVYFLRFPLTKKLPTLVEIRQWYSTDEIFLDYSLLICTTLLGPKMSRKCSLLQVSKFKDMSKILSAGDCNGDSGKLTMWYHFLCVFMYTLRLYHIVPFKWLKICSLNSQFLMDHLGPTRMSAPNDAPKRTYKRCHGENDDFYHLDLALFSPIFWGCEVDFDSRHPRRCPKFVPALRISSSMRCVSLLPRLRIHTLSHLQSWEKLQVL